MARLTSVLYYPPEVGQIPVTCQNMPVPQCVSSSVPGVHIVAPVSSASSAPVGAQFVQVGANDALISLTNSVAQLCNIVYNRFSAVVPPPPAFSGEKDTVLQFLAHYREYAKSVFGDDRAHWVYVLTNCLGRKAKEVFRAIGGSLCSYDEIKEHLKCKFGPDWKVFCSPMVAEFNSTIRLPTESWAIFYSRLQRLDKTSFPGTPGVVVEELLKTRLAQMIPKDIEMSLFTFLSMTNDFSSTNMIEFLAKSSSFQSVMVLPVVPTSQVSLAVQLPINTLTDSVNVVQGRGEQPMVVQCHDEKPVYVRSQDERPSYSSPVRESDPQFRQAAYKKVSRQFYQAEFQRDNQQNSYHSNSPKMCSFCKKPGHLREFCRRRLGLCLWCGGEGDIECMCVLNWSRAGEMLIQSRFQ